VPRAAALHGVIDPRIDVTKRESEQRADESGASKQNYADGSSTRLPPPRRARQSPFRSNELIANRNAVSSLATRIRARELTLSLTGFAIFRESTHRSHRRSARLSPRRYCQVARKARAFCSFRKLSSYLPPELGMKLANTGSVNRFHDSSSKFFRHLSQIAAARLHSSVFSDLTDRCSIASSRYRNLISRVPREVGMGEKS